VWEETGTVIAVERAAVGSRIVVAVTETSTGAGEADGAGKTVKAIKTIKAIKTAVGADKTVVALGFT
jgi:hypothetical protein